MRPVSRVQVIALLVAFACLSAFAGLLVARLEVMWLLAIGLGAIALGLVFVDYRVGVVCLTIMLPWVWSIGCRSVLSMSASQI